MTRPALEKVYYSDFWYSRLLRPVKVDFGGSLVADEITQHKFRFRLLSLFFQQIYIPRTHLLTHIIDPQVQIPKAIIDTDEFKYLLNCGILNVSSFPGLSAAEDNERITSRRSKTNIIIYPTDKSFLFKLPITGTITVDTMKEAQWNTISFPDYIKILQLQDLASAHIASEAIKRAALGDIPFFHEHFIMSLRDKLQREAFEKIWRETNSIYLMGGAPDETKMAPYFNEEIESVNYRFLRGLDRYLFSPSSLYTFVSIFLSSEQVSKFIYGPIEDTHDFLTDTSRSALTREFRQEFQDLIWTLSFYSQSAHVRSELHQTTIRSLFEIALSDGFRKKSSLAEKIVEDAAKVSREAGLAGGGLLSTLVGAGLHYGRGAVEDWLRSRKYPKIVEHMKAMKRSLDSVSLPK